MNQILKIPNVLSNQRQSQKIELNLIILHHLIDLAAQTIYLFLNSDSFYNCIPQFHSENLLAAVIIIH